MAVKKFDLIAIEFVIVGVELLNTPQSLGRFGSALREYRWTPISQAQNGFGDGRRVSLDRERIYLDLTATRSRVRQEYPAEDGLLPHDLGRSYSDGQNSLADVEAELELPTAGRYQLPGNWETDATDILLSRLDDLRKSGDRYVYPGGKRPVDAAFVDARLFLKNLVPLRITPTISLVADGEINFAWESDGVHIDLGFYGDGEGGSYYAEDSSGRQYHCDSFPPKELPHDIARLID